MRGLSGSATFRSALGSASGRAVFSRESRAELLRGRYSCSMRCAHLLASLPHFDVAHREAATHGRVRTPLRPDVIRGDPIVPVGAAGGRSRSVASRRATGHAAPHTARGLDGASGSGRGKCTLGVSVSERAVSTL
jgi:hypothetical protein